MRVRAIFLLGILPSITIAALNGHCKANHRPGVCVKTSDCTAEGGHTVDNACPDDPADVKCCYKNPCQTGDGDSQCRWTPPGDNSCSGETVSNQCPGPGDFKCCLNPGTWGLREVPENRCKSHVITAGNQIANEFKGKISQMWCYGERTTKSDHPSGLAIDFMVGTYSPAGFELADFVMNNCSKLKCKYIIWGQRIWEQSVDDDPKDWEDWKKMGDRGSINSNHWNHVHVSFKSG